MTLTLGVDVSTYQDPSGSGDRNLIDWSAVAPTPYDFALARMSIGRGTRDEDGRQNLRAMLGRIPVAGAYGVVGTSEPVTDGAKLLVDEVAACGVDPRSILIMLDAENFGDGSHPTLAQINRYAVQLHAELGAWPAAYVPDWFLDQLARGGDGDGTVRGLELANCRWVPSEYLPAPWTEDRIRAKRPTNLRGFAGLAWHQFTSSGSVPGISGRVDLNAFYGTLTELRSQLLGQQEDIVGQLDGFPTDTNYRDFFIKLKDQGVWLNDHGDQAVGGSSNNHKAIMAKLASIAAGVGALSDDEANVLAALQGSESRILSAVAAVQAGDPGPLVEEIRKLPDATVAAIKEAL